MRHYEIVLLLNITNETQYKKFIEKYLFIIKENNGLIHRLENWGKRELAYSINKLNRAYYILINIECDIFLMKELEKNFKSNNLILRNLILNKKNSIKDPSPIMNKINEKIKN